MADAAQLLRLLEPAVRPVAQPSPTRPTGPAPFESRSFDDLLQDAGLVLPDDADFNPKPDPEIAKTTDPLAALADLSRIENPGLRNLLAARG